MGGCERWLRVAGSIWFETDGLETGMPGTGRPLSKESRVRRVRDKGRHDAGYNFLSVAVSLKVLPPSRRAKDNRRFSSGMTTKSDGRDMNGANRFGLRIFTGIVFLVLSTTGLHAQGEYTATRAVEFSGFGGLSEVDPSYGANWHQIGYLFGFDVTVFHKFYFYPSLEGRASLSPKGTAAGERVFSGGVKLSHFYGRFVPYVDFLAGTGTIRYTRPLTPSAAYLIGSDNSIVYTYGAGLDVNVGDHFRVKADFQSSHWNLALVDVLTPAQVSVGLVYHTR
jgi:hypothetical protein